MTLATSKSKHGRACAQRLETRLTAEQKRLIERAAVLQGRTITDLPRSSAASPWTRNTKTRAMALSCSPMRSAAPCAARSRPLP